jgi:hypothetical protein
MMIRLISRLNGQAIYDTDLNITWLANAEYASQLNANYSSNQSYVTWNNAIDEIATLNSQNLLGFSDWRLPKSTSNCGIGYNLACSEIGHLYYIELEGISNTLTKGLFNSNSTLFSNLQNNFNFWTSTEYPQPQSSMQGIYVFNTLGGFQSAFTKDSNVANAWLVRTGDVSPVPETSTYIMLVFGLGLFGFYFHNRKELS